MVCIVGTGEADYRFADRNCKSAVPEASFNGCKCHRQWAKGISNGFI